MPMKPVAYRDLVPGGHYFLERELSGTGAYKRRLRAIVKKVEEGKYGLRIHYVDAKHPEGEWTSNEDDDIFYEDTKWKLTHDKTHVGPRVRQHMLKELRQGVVNKFQEARADALGAPLFPAYFTARMKTVARRKHTSAAKKRLRKTGHAVHMNTLKWNPKR